MITATMYKQGDDVYLIWSFTTIDEQRALRRLLKGTETRVGVQVSRFITKVPDASHQMSLDE